MATGFDLIDAAIDAFHGIRPEIHIKRSKGLILDNDLYAELSVIGRVEGLRGLLENGLIGSHIYKSPGSSIEEGVSSNSRLAALTLSSSAELVGLKKSTT